MKIILSLLLVLLTACSFATKTRSKIAVIDSGITAQIPNEYLCETGHKDFTGKGIDDTLGHGTNVVGLIIKEIDPKKSCIIVLKVFDNSFASDMVISRAIRHATMLNVKYINMSLSGTFSSYIETLFILDALRMGIKIAVAAGNSSRDLSESCDVYPACYIKHPNFHVVESWTKDVKHYFTNYNITNSYKEDGFRKCYKDICMTGTSQATAIHMGKWVHSDE